MPCWPGSIKTLTSTPCKPNTVHNRKWYPVPAPHPCPQSPSPSEQPHNNPARQGKENPYQLKLLPQVLSGSGVYDGSEVHEASAALVGLTRSGAEVMCYAPDAPQMHVIDHTKVRAEALLLYWVRQGGSKLVICQEVFVNLLEWIFFYLLQLLYITIMFLLICLLRFVLMCIYWFYFLPGFTVY